jgi:hypothetical protein
MPDLELVIEPLLKEVPIGAPVRVNVTLINRGNEAVVIPEDIGLKSSHMTGAVSNPSGVERSFRPLVYYEKLEQLQSLEPGKSITTSLTLLRGGQGALFPTSGVADITVKVGWDIADGLKGYVMGQTTVMVTPSVDKSHAAVAHTVLTTPDTLPVLVLGGDHLKDDISAVQQALDDEILRPHYACVEARRLAQRFFGRGADVEAAKVLVSGWEVVMSDAEKAKLEKMGVQCA